MNQAKRRQFLMAASALLASPLARAQAPAKLPTLGVLLSGPKPPPQVVANYPTRKRLRELGWIDGKTLLVENAYGEGNEDRLPALAAMLVAKRVDAIWAFGPEAALAAARATKTIPIVFWGVAFPVEQGLVDSLAKPGRNVTGVGWWSTPEVEAKRMQLLREVVPDALRLALLEVPSTVRTVAGGRVTIADDARDAASHKLRFELRRFPVLKAADFEPAFAEIVKWRARALLVAGTFVTWRAKDQIFAFALRHRLPAMYGGDGWVAAGGLVSYASAILPAMVRSADYVDKILRGTNPAELPVDLPARYELSVNLKTAKALGITIPPSIKLSADHVFE